MGPGEFLPVYASWMRREGGSRNPRAHPLLRLRGRKSSRAAAGSQYCPALGILEAQVLTWAESRVWSVGEVTAHVVRGEPGNAAGLDPASHSRGFLPVQEENLSKRKGG